jgi:hypothetical protein
VRELGKKIQLGRMWKELEDLQGTLGAHEEAELPGVSGADLEWELGRNADARDPSPAAEGRDALQTVPLLRVRRLGADDRDEEARALASPPVPDDSEEQVSMSADLAELAMERAADAQAAYRTHTNAANGWREAGEKLKDPLKKRIYEELENWQRSAAAIALASASRFSKMAAQFVAVDGRRRAGSVWSAQNDDLVARTNKVPCPQCGAKEGHFCVDNKGTDKMTTNHYARRAAARVHGFVKGGRKRR